MNSTPPWSRMPGFFSLNLLERRELLQTLPLALTHEDFAALDQGLGLALANEISENVIGTFALPLSTSMKFVVDGEPVLVPMVTEEPSIVAACSKLAKMTAAHGGFTTHIGEPLLKGQIQFFAVRDVDRALERF